MTEKRDNLINGNIFKLMMELSIPGIIGMLVIGLYSFVDAIFVGRYVGEVALGAVGLAYAYTLINNGIAVLIGIGSASVLSRAVGREDKATIDAIMGNVLNLTLILSIITTIFGYIFAPNLLKLVGADGEMLDFGVVYLRIVFLASVFVNFGQASNMVMRGEGRMALAMTFMGASAILNIFLDYLFIVVFAWGVEGAAYATFISQIELGLSQFIYFKYFSRDVSFASYKLQKNIIKETFAVGISAMFMQVFALVQQVVMYATLKKYGGEDQIVLMTGFFRYLMLAFIPLWGLSQGYQPFVGTNFGAGRYDRVKQGTYMFYIFALILALIFWLAFIIFPENIMAWFINNPELVHKGRLNALLSISLFPLSAIMIINLTMFQALGKAKEAGILVVGRQVAFYIPAVLLLPLAFGTTGVWIANPVVDGFVALVSVIIVIKIFTKELVNDKKVST